MKLEQETGSGRERLGDYRAESGSGTGNLRPGLPDVEYSRVGRVAARLRSRSPKVAGAFEAQMSRARMQSSPISRLF